jgi:hypothetical protein
MNKISIQDRKTPGSQARDYFSTRAQNQKPNRYAQYQKSSQEPDIESKYNKAGQRYNTLMAHDPMRTVTSHPVS